MDPALQIELSALSRLKEVNEGIKEGDSCIQKFYMNSTVFLTGGTGFLGKHMIEKLLRSCNIAKIFLLLRSKKGKTMRERLDEMLEDPVFEYLKTIKPDFGSKISCVEGDVAEIRLGLQEQDWQTLADEVEVIFHCAATTRFDERLRVATLVNVRGTREILQLARQVENLKSFVHVSTAYSHATSTVVDQSVQEQFYQSPIPPDTLISMAEQMEGCRLDDITNNLIKSWPNTYTFTKAVAEETVRRLSEGIPICILRPGIVVAAHYEPAPGWIDKSAVYSASGILLGIGLGVLHVVLNDHEKRVGLVPCDYVSNAAIVAGRETACLQRKEGNDTMIYAISSSARNPVTWGDLSSSLKNDCPRIASPSSVYYAYGLETSSMMVYSVLALFLHVIPAYILDLICFFIGRERMYKVVMDVSDSEMMYHKMLKELCEKYRKIYSKELEAQLYGGTDRKICETIVQVLKLPISADELEFQVSTMAQKMLPTAPLKKGAERLLMHLRDSKIPMALATNSTEQAIRWHTASRPSLFGMFHHKVSVTDPEVDRGKPHPDIYLVAASRFPDKPKPIECLVFEDSLVGVKAAKAAGMQVVMIPDRRVDREDTRHASLVIRSLLHFKPELFGLPPFGDPKQKLK